MAENENSIDDLLIPAIIQDFNSNEVLMLAYMNRESFIKSIVTQTTWFWSRSRKELWNKGQTSGNIQIIKEIDMTATVMHCFLRFSRKDLPAILERKAAFLKLLRPVVIKYI